MSAKIEEETKAVEGLQKAEASVKSKQEARAKMEEVKKESIKPDFTTNQMQDIFGQIMQRKGAIPKEESEG